MLALQGPELAVTVQACHVPHVLASRRPQLAVVVQAGGIPHRLASQWPELAVRPGAAGFRTCQHCRNPQCSGRGSQWRSGLAGLRTGQHGRNSQGTCLHHGGRSSQWRSVPVCAARTRLPSARSARAYIVEVAVYILALQEPELPGTMRTGRLLAFLGPLC